MSDVRLSRTSDLSRTERPRKAKIGTEVAHVTRDSDTTFKVKRSKVNLHWAGAYCGGLPHSLLLNRRRVIRVVHYITLLRHTRLHILLTIHGSGSLPKFNDDFLV